MLCKYTNKEQEVTTSLTSGYLCKVGEIGEERENKQVKGYLNYAVDIVTGDNNKKYAVINNRNDFVLCNNKCTAGTVEASVCSSGGACAGSDVYTCTDNKTYIDCTSKGKRFAHVCDDTKGCEHDSTLNTDFCWFK